MNRFKTLMSGLLCTALITGCGAKSIPASNFEESISTPPLITTASYNSPTEPIVETEPPLINIETLPTYYQINVPALLQEPELPTGCEITSLTCLLNYLGFSVDKVVMADTYLDKALENGIEYSFYEKYIGDPKTNGYGCYSPVIVKAATAFLADQNSHLEAVNLSGMSKDDILMTVASGHPVVIWNTLSTRDFEEKLVWTTPNGTEVYWTSLEHCMLLTGYNMDENTVTVCDPMKGVVSYDLTQFFNVYDKLHQQAMTIY